MPEPINTDNTHEISGQVGRLGGTKRVEKIRCQLIQV